MNISLKRLKSLTTEETTFVFAMMSKYGGLKIEEQPVHNNNNNKHNKHRKNNNRPKNPPKTTKNHDNCTSNEPCLYDFDCPGWEKCNDEKFLQYRLILNKCEK